MATTRKIIFTEKASHVGAAPLPLSQAVLVDKTLYVSGQLGTDDKGQLVSGIEAQTRRTLEKIGYVLNAAGATFKDVVKVTVLLADISHFSAMNKVYGEFFTEKFPARMAFQVACLPIPAALVEIEAVAIVGGIKDV